MGMPPQGNPPPVIPASFNNYTVQECYISGLDLIGTITAGALANYQIFAAKNAIGYLTDDNAKLIKAFIKLKIKYTGDQDVTTLKASSIQLQRAALGYNVLPNSGNLPNNSFRCEKAGSTAYIEIISDVTALFTDIDGQYDLKLNAACNAGQMYMEIMTSIIFHFQNV